MRKGSSFDVVLLGAGVTGLSAALHLRQQGVQRVALCGGPAGATAASAGVLSGGQLDNFTRVSHAHGADFAASLWRFGDAAFDSVIAYCHSSGVPHQTHGRVRLITSEAELVEARLATAELVAAGFPASLSEPAKHHALGAKLEERVLAVQDDGPRGGWIDTGRLLARLDGDTADVERLPTARGVKAAADGLAVTLADGQTVKGQLVVVAAHLGTRLFVPELHQALVPYADQWSDVELADDAGKPDAAGLSGLSFSANHTYEWGVITAPGHMRLGGGRYLRPMAGIEAETATVESKITEHLRGQLAKTFSFGKGARMGQTTAALEIRPCDELPVIGPMFGESRLLIATGYMGQGLTLGFYAGRCLAELVQTGTCERLPRRLWPERLRTLEA